MKRLHDIMTMHSGDCQPKKLYPWYVLVISDILLTAVILCTFSYFHHVRMLWGIGASGEKTENVYTFTKSAEPPDLPLQSDTEAVTTQPSASEPLQTPAVGHTSHTLGSDGRCTVCGTELLDLSGDFGASFPTLFIQDSERVSLNDDGEIQDYASANGISLRQDSDGKYIALYRSHDVFLTIQEIDTMLEHPDWEQPFKVQYYIYDIYVRNIDNLFTGYSTGLRYPADKLIDMTEKEENVSVVAAVNGDYMANLNHCLLCERNGSVLRDIPENIESDICVLYYDGTMETLSPSEYDWNSIKAKVPYQIWNFGPGLLDGDGKALEKFDSSAYDWNVVDSSHPRTSIGYYEPGHYNFVVVDGRSGDSHGVKMTQLAQIQQSLGCKAAYNMDGGDSAQAYFDDTVIRESARREEQRKLPDLICVGEVSE